MAASPVLLGAVAGAAVALIFFLRMRIESFAGKAGTKQAFAGGFETEDVLYLLPLDAVRRRRAVPARGVDRRPAVRRVGRVRLVAHRPARQRFAEPY